MPTRKSTPKKTADREVNNIGQSFVADGREIHGTPSDTHRAGSRGAYAASSVIERGTANKLRTEIDDDKHLCICGCGQSPSNVDSLFMPGHDSKVRAMGKAILENRIDRKNVYKPALQYLEQGGMLG